MLSAMRLTHLLCLERNLFAEPIRPESMVPVAAAASILNGERAVVMLFISVIMFSLPLSLMDHGVALCLLALAAFFVETCLEFSPPIISQFKIRPGASSGILIGAVTLPGVFISKLIQLSRALSLHRVSIQEVEYLKMQYWAAIAVSIGVIFFFWLLVKELHGSSYSLCSHLLWPVRSGTSFTSLCAVFCCLSLASVSYYGLRPELRLVWVICHGFAAIKLIQHLLNTFPSCASIGEALLVTSGIVLYLGDMLMCTSAKISETIASPDIIISGYRIDRSEISIIIQGVLVGLLLFPLLFKVIHQILEYFTSTKSNDSRAQNDFRRSLLFFLSLCFILTIIIPSWMQFVQVFDLHPVLWVFNFVFQDPLKRLTLCIYWVALIVVSVLRFYNISKNSKMERILLRKYYHLLAVSMFSPALIYQEDFLDLALGAALAVFLVLEIVRVWKIWPFGELIHKFMNAFTDHRDSDLLIISHFSLLLGCALPMWLSSGYNDRPLAPFAGILSLGIGDTMASIVGHKYGVLRWSKSGKKTIEGTAAGITSVLASCFILVPVLASNGYIQQEALHWMWVLVAVTVSGLLEAYTAQLDNAFIPLVFYSLLICR